MMVKTSWSLLNESGRTSKPPDGMTRVWKRSRPEARTIEVDSSSAGDEWMAEMPRTCREGQSADSLIDVGEAGY
jgi:hypothetical protein